MEISLVDRNDKKVLKTFVMLLENNLRDIFLNPGQRNTLINNLKYIGLEFRWSKLKKVRFMPQIQNN